MLLLTPFAALRAAVASNAIGQRGAHPDGKRAVAAMADDFFRRLLLNKVCAEPVPHASPAERRPEPRLPAQHSPRLVVVTDGLPAGIIACCVDEARAEGRGWPWCAMEAQWTLHVPFYSNFFFHVCWGLLRCAGVPE